MALVCAAFSDNECTESAPSTLISQHHRLHLPEINTECECFGGLGPRYLPSTHCHQPASRSRPTLEPRIKTKLSTFPFSAIKPMDLRFFNLIDKVPLNQWMSRVGCSATRIRIPSSTGLIPNNSGPHAHLMRCFFLLETRTDTSHHGISF